MVVPMVLAVAFVAAEECSKKGDAPVALTGQQQRVIESAGWRDRVGDGFGVWVSIADQMLRIVRNGVVVWQAPCSTAANGPGSKADSLQTPLGWHSVVEKIGDGKPWGQVFREKRATREVWHSNDITDHHVVGDSVEEDLVLTRLLALTGEEPGKNKGGDVDSYARGIYIHGTNAEERIGQPASHGCVRLTNDDVIAAYERIPIGTLVLITE